MSVELVGYSWRGLPVLLALLVSWFSGPAGGQQRHAAPRGCFQKPSRCGYPDATNTGVPRGTHLVPSRSRYLSHDGATLDGVRLTGTVVVDADGVTIRNSKLRLPRGGSGTAVIKLSDGAEDFTIKDSEVYGGSGPRDAIESAVWNISNNRGARAIRTYFHGCSECWHGSGTFRDAYVAVNAGYPGSHDEDIYLCGGRVDVRHSTLVNLHRQTATVFGDTTCGGGNRMKVTRSLLAGGGFLLYPQANSEAKTGHTTVVGNRLARCASRERYHPRSGGHTCSGGRDRHGLYPLGGFYGVAAAYWPGRGSIWRNNFWDDTLRPVCPDGGRGCGHRAGSA